MMLILLAGCAAEPPSISIDGDDIAGVVTSSNGPEAGVWVIAEATNSTRCSPGSS